MQNLTEELRQVISEITPGDWASSWEEPYSMGADRIIHNEDGTYSYNECPENSEWENFSSTEELFTRLGI